MQTYLYLDTETGGIHPPVHALLSIGAVAPTGERFEHYILPESQPGKTVDPAAAAVNGYTPEAWAMRQARPLQEVIERLTAWLEHFKSLPIVAHNAAFDRAFLQEAERVTGLQMPHRSSWRCTQVLLGQLMDLGLVPYGSSSLDRLSVLASVAGDRNPIHNAIEDAMRTRAGHEWLLKVMRGEVPGDPYNELAKDGAHSVYCDNKPAFSPCCRAPLECLGCYVGGGSHYWALRCSKCDSRFSYDTHGFDLYPVEVTMQEVAP